MGWSSLDFHRRVGLLLTWGLVGGFEATDEEFSTKSNVDVHVAVHSMFRE